MIPQDFFFLTFIFKSQMARLKMGKEKKTTTTLCLSFLSGLDSHNTPTTPLWEEGLYFPLFPRVDFVLVK